MAIEDVFGWLRLGHISGGVVALLTAYAALLVKRGAQQHRMFGRWFVYAMVIVVVTGAPMSIIHPNPFLFGVTIFSGYFVYSGYSGVINRSGEIGILDRAAATILLVGSLVALAGIGYVTVAGIPYRQTFLITGAVFAIIGAAVSSSDLYRFRTGWVTGKDRIIKHLVSMCAGLIATTTAAAVTVLGSVPSLPALVSWLGPTVLISPIIFYWVRQVRIGTFRY